MIHANTPSSPLSSLPPAHLPPASPPSPPSPPLPPLTLPPCMIRGAATWETLHFVTGQFRRVRCIEFGSAEPYVELQFRDDIEAVEANRKQLDRAARERRERELLREEELLKEQELALQASRDAYSELTALTESQWWNSDGRGVEDSGDNNVVPSRPRSGVGGRSIGATIGGDHAIGGATAQRPAQTFGLATPSDASATDEVLVERPDDLLDSGLTKMLMGDESGPEVPVPRWAGGPQSWGVSLDVEEPTTASEPTTLDRDRDSGEDTTMFLAERSLLEFREQVRGSRARAWDLADSNKKRSKRVEDFWDFPLKLEKVKEDNKSGGYRAGGGLAQLGGYVFEPGYYVTTALDTFMLCQEFYFYFSPPHHCVGRFSGEEKWVLRTVWAMSPPWGNVCCGRRAGGWVVVQRGIFFYKQRGRCSRAT